MKTKNKRNTLRQNFSWVLMGNIFFAFSQWFLILLFAKMGNVSMIGEYSIALAITAPIFLFLNFNLRTLQATDLKEKTKFVEYLFFRIVSSVVAIIIVYIFAEFLNYENQLFEIIMLMAILKFFESLSDLSYGFFQQQERMEYIAISKISRGSLTILTQICILLMTESLSLTICGMIIINFITLVMYDLRKVIFLKEINELNIRALIVQKKRGFISFGKFKKIFIIALPLGISGAIDSLNINSQRFIIENSLGTVHLGIYASIVFLMTAGHTVVGALAHAALPRLSTYYVSNLDKFYKLFKLLTFLGIIIGVLLVSIAGLVGEKILVILYSEEFVGYQKLFVLIMIAASIWYISGFINTALLSTKKFHSQLALFSFSTATTFILSYYLVPVHDLIGAAYSLIGGMTVRVILGLLILNFHIKKEYKNHKED